MSAEIKMRPLRLVLVEDSPDDTEFILHALKLAGMNAESQRVETEAEYLRALEGNPDIVLCDYGLPQFSTQRALKLLRKHSDDIPFIIVSGHIGDTVAVSMLKAGANDYVLKDNLVRLPPSIERELREAKARRRQKWLEDALRVVADAVSGVTGKAFLESLVVQLANAIEVDAVFIGELVDPATSIVKNVATSIKQPISENLSYQLQETFATGQIFVGNTESDPSFPLLVETQLHSYMGVPLVSSAGLNLGVIVVVHSSTIANVQMAESLLRIYAVRAASEIERMAQTAKLEFQATHDPLTRLSNRHVLYTLVTAMINSDRKNANGALLLIDLDGFKEINDTLGHQSGDDILKQIGPRLLPLLKPGQQICRLGGDEFGVLITDNVDSDSAEETAKTLLYAIREPFEIAGISLQMGASIGIALYPDHGRNANELLRQADVAMYLAKKDAAGYRVYDSALDVHTRDRLTLMTELRHAIENNELVLHYQPKIDLVGKNSISLEALVRWQHSERGLLSPAEFLPLAEMTDLIGPLALWVMDAACHQCHEWRKAGYPVNVAVNISARNLLDVRLPEIVAEIVRLHEIAPKWLEFEITESSIMKDPQRCLEVLQRISYTGHVLSIDDFGTGHSSLAYLTQLPVQHLKIDRAFVRQMISSLRDASIVQSTIGLAHNLGMQVIAEGVEDSETLDRLRGLGCDQAQGYFISMPKPVEEVEAWMNRHGIVQKNG